MKRIGVALTFAFLALPPAGHAALAAPGSSCANSDYIGAPVYSFKSVTSTGSFYAQVSPAVAADVGQKIVVRVTGQGPLTLTSNGPNGQTISPTWFEAHTVGSSWDGVVPGDEWGSGWVFPSAGCWDLHAVRGDVVADIYVDAAMPDFSGVGFKLASPRHSIHSDQKITLSVGPDITPGPVQAGLSGKVTIRRAGKAVRVLKLKASGLQVYRLSTRLTVRKPTWFTARASVTFNGTTMSRVVRFRVLPASGS